MLMVVLVLAATAAMAVVDAHQGESGSSRGRRVVGGFILPFGQTSRRLPVGSSSSSSSSSSPTTSSMRPASALSRSSTRRRSSSSSNDESADLLKAFGKGKGV